METAETFRLIRAQRGRETQVYLYGRNEEGKKKFSVKSFSPYLYVPLEEFHDSESITNEEYGYTSIYGDDLRKVFVSNPSEVPRVRSEFTKHFEADIPYARRFLIDRKIRAYFKVVEIYGKQEIIGDEDRRFNEY